MTRPEGGAPAASGPRPALVDALRQLSSRDHAALVDSDGDAAEPVAAFLLVGLERGERCVHLADEDGATRVLPHLRAAGVDAGEALASGQLALATDRDVFLRPGPLTPAEVGQLLAEKAAAARKDGARGLRLSAEASWFVEAQASLEDVLEYERMVQRVAVEHGVAGLWRYRRATFPAAVLRVLVRAHPVLVHKGEVHRSHLFAPPGEAAADPGGDLEHLLETVSERDRAEASFAESGERVRSALAGGAHALWEWDLQRQDLAVNTRWAEIAGLPASPGSVSVAAWEQAIHPDDLARVWVAVREHVADRTARLDVEYRVKHRDGTWRWVRLRGAVAGRDAGGRAARLAGTLTDVSDVHAALEQALARERFAAVGSLAAGVAHEINTPLAWMTTNLAFVQDLLASWPPPAGPEAASARQALEVLEETRQGVARIRDTVDALQAVGRPAGAAAPARCDVREELLAAVAMARHEVVHRARLTVSVPDALPPVLSHPGALRRVFLQLLLNAAQAVAAGPPAAHEVQVTAAAAAGAVTVEVRDTGVGMTPHVRAQVFDPFFTTKGGGQNVGLGLSFARTLVEASQGRIEVDSAPRRGTTLRVVLPAAPDEAAGGREPAPRSARRRVLVVDDEELLVRAYARILERDDDVTALTSAAAALRRLGTGESWDAILLDLQMPDMDGIELFEKIELTRPDLVPRVAFMTGGAFTPRALAFLDRTSRPTLAKPVDAAALRAVVAQLAG